MFFAGILVGVVVVFLALSLLVSTLPPRPDSSIMTGQLWRVKGVGPIKITKVLNSGDFKEFGHGVNIQYILPNGEIGHTTSKSLVENGTIILLDQEKIQKSIDASKIKRPTSAYIYDKNAKTKIIDVKFKGSD